MKSKKEKLVENAKKKKVEEANVDNITPNKAGFLIIGLTLLMLVSFGIYFASDMIKNKSNNNTVEAEKFEKEYEDLNCSDKEDCKYLEVNIDDNNNIKYSSYEEVFKILEDGTGVIYFGFPECPWCRNLVPVLLDAQEEVGLETIYYLNNVEDRNTLEVNDEGEVVTSKEGTEDYFKLVEELGDFATDYTLEKDGKEVNTNQKRLYFPTVLFVKEGEIVGFHEGTVSSQTNPQIELTEKQEKELKDILTTNMEKVISCTGSC